MQLTIQLFKGAHPRFTSRTAVVGSKHFLKTAEQAHVSVEQTMHREGLKRAIRARRYFEKPKFAREAFENKCSVNIYKREFRKKIELLNDLK